MTIGNRNQRAKATRKISWKILTLTSTMSSPGVYGFGVPATAALASYFLICVGVFGPASDSLMPPSSCLRRDSTCGCQTHTIRQKITPRTTDNMRNFSVTTYPTDAVSCTRMYVEDTNINTPCNLFNRSAFGVCDRSSPGDGYTSITSYTRHAVTTKTSATSATTPTPTISVLLWLAHFTYHGLPLQCRKNCLPWCGSRVRSWYRCRPPAHRRGSRGHTWRQERVKFSPCFSAWPARSGSRGR